MLSKRRLARVLAVQACYASYFYAYISHNELIEVTIKLQECKPYIAECDYDLFCFLSSKVYEEKLAAEKLIQQFLTQGWEIGRIDKLQLAILRNGICELKYLSDINLRDSIMEAATLVTPRKIIIHEYVSMAPIFIPEKNIGFINAMLDNIAKCLDPDSITEESS